MPAGRRASRRRRRHPRPSFSAFGLQPSAFPRRAPSARSFSSAPPASAKPNLPAPFEGTAKHAKYAKAGAKYSSFGRHSFVCLLSGQHFLSVFSCPPFVCSAYLAVEIPCLAESLSTARKTSCASARQGAGGRGRQAAYGVRISKSGAAWAKWEGLRVTMRLAPLRRAKVAWRES